MTATSVPVHPVPMPALLKKSILSVIIILVYFLVLRDIRGMIRNAHLGSILPAEYGEFQEGIDFSSPSSVSFNFYTNMGEVHKKWTYKIPFGLFFLLAMVGMVFVNGSGKEYFGLVAIHVFGGIISFVFLWLAVQFGYRFLIIPDLIARYLVPICSLGLVALTYVQNKNLDSNEEKTD